MSSTIEQVIREATPDELSDMSPTIRWAYERGIDVAYWIRDEVFSLCPEKPRPDLVIILRRGV